MDADSVDHYSMTVKTDMDESLTRLLSSLVQKTNALIVLSTAWRLQSSTLELLLNHLTEAGIPRSRIVGSTPDLEDCPSEEISDFKKAATRYC